jgi:uncharacterized protein YqiB (DUF1249 family)
MTHTIPLNRLYTSSQILRTFEENYRFLLRLLAPLFSGAEAMTLGQDPQGGMAGSPLSATVCERHKYMTIVELKQQIAEDPQIPDIRLRLRLYFDARVAEVIAYQGVERIPARYQIKPSRGDVRDEKVQVNLLLNDFLKHIINRGYRTAVISDVSVLS